MSQIFDIKTRQFLFTSFKNQANNQNIIKRDITDANNLYQYLLDKFGIVDNMSDEEVESIKVKLNKWKNDIKKIQNIINFVTKQLNTINGILKILLTIIKVARIIIKILKALPIPAQFLTSGVIVTFSDKLQKADRKIEQIEIIIRSVQPFLNIIIRLLNNVKNLLNILNQIITLIEAFLSARNKKYLEEKQEEPLLLIEEQQNNLGIDNGNNNIIGFYNGFTFILKQENDPRYQVGELKRNYAVAIDSFGKERIKSDSSFASDPQILIDELKFQIDSNNLQA